MKKIVFTSIIFLTSILNSYCQDRHHNDSIKASLLINKELNSLKSNGITKDNIISFYDDTGRIVIAWKVNEKYKAIKMYYKGNKCDKAKKQRLSKTDKQNLSMIFKKPHILSKISNSICDERVHSFNKVHIRIDGYENSFLSHCKQDNELEPLVSLYFSLRK